MELSNIDLEQVNKDELINSLMEQNTNLRLEIAMLSSLIKTEGNELHLLRQMKNSQNIPPEIWEKLSKLDIR